MTRFPRTLLHSLLAGAGVVFLAASVQLAPVVAHAQDSDSSDAGDDLDEDETEEERKAREEAEKNRLDDADDLDLLDDEDALDSIESTGEETGDDLLGNTVEQDTIDAEGQDNSQIYRDAQMEYEEFAPDEEMLAWERYLQKYPNSLYKTRIERRIDDLEEILYLDRKTNPDEERLDADQRDVPISQGLLLQNINPTTRLLTGFEWGLPDYINLMADYEHGLRRDLSIHVGLRNRFQTWGLEFGGRYALVKSSRTQTLLTGIVDVRAAMNPAYIAVRPQVAFGKMVGIVDFQVQAGVDYELRKDSALRVIGGGNVTVRADENVAVFVETNVNAKNLTWDEGGSFRFPVGSFGVKFYPSIEGQPKGFMEINVGASVPYATNYYRWHDGSIMGQLNVYL